MLYAGRPGLSPGQAGAARLASHLATLAVALFMVAAAPHLVPAQGTGQSQRGNAVPPVPKPEFSTLPARFQFDPVPSSDLQRLWSASVDAKREMVACLAGEAAGDDVRVTRVLILESRRGDSLGVAAQASIDRCGPPEFQGTVHTHVAHHGGQPYVTFSGADIGVMRLWWRRWQVEGYFCVIYSAIEAYCEANLGGRPIRRSRGAY